MQVGRQIDGQVEREKKFGGKRKKEGMKKKKEKNDQEPVVETNTIL